MNRPLKCRFGTNTGFIVQSAQFERPGQTMATIAGTILAVAFVGILGSFMIQMRWFDSPYHGILPLVFLVSTAKGADTGAYTFGRIAGRHKLILSPEEEFALTRGEHGHPERQGYGQTRVADITGDRPDRDAEPTPSGT